MKKISYFLMVGLAFTVLQVGVAGAAEDCSQFPGTGAAKAECEAANAAADGGTPGMPATTVAPALTIGDPLCVVAPALRDPGCPNAMPGTSATMAPPAPNMPPPTMAPPGAPGMAHLGDHCGVIQAKNEKKRMRKEVKCLRRALHEHKPTVKLRQTKDGLGAYGCGVKKTGSKTAQIACLRSLLDAPSGKPGMAPGTN